MGSVQRSLILAVLLSAVSGCATPGSYRPVLPWEFNAPRADGYAIDLVDVKPAPGTPLAAGNSVDFFATVKYSLSITRRGRIFLIFEDENDHMINPKRTVVIQQVSSPSGELTLKGRIAVPIYAKELRLFIPLDPQGFSHTTGEVTIRYPIVRR
jgi:hypothetical protein